MKTIIGTWNYPNGTPVDGTLYLQLSQSATAVGTAQISPRNLVIPLESGSIPLNYTLWANDEISPGGTYYTATVVTGGGTVWGPENLGITGTSPINLNTLIAVTTNFFSSALVFQSPTLATPNITGGFTIGGAAPVGHVPRGNGSFYVDAQLNFSDLAGSFTFDQLGSGTNTTATMVVGSGASLSATGGGSIAATSFVGTITFSQLASGTNTTAALVVGSGSSLAASGTGTIAATSLTTPSLVLTNPISSATPATNRTLDAEPSLTAASVAVAGGGSIAAVRGNLTVNTGTTVTAGYLYGTQGKLTIKGTINQSAGEYNAGLVGQLDLSTATAITSVNGLSMLWLDAGAASAVPLTSVAAINITNSIAGKPLKAVIDIPLADAQFFLISQDTADSPWSADPGASGKTFQNVGLKVKCNGVTYWLPLFA